MKELLFSLVRLALDDESVVVCPKLSEKQWNQLFSLACRHNVAGLVAESVKGLADEVRPSEDVCLKFVAMQGMTISDFQHKLQVAQQLQRFYAEHHLKVAFLKGFQLCRYYPQQELRSFSDLDIYLTHEDGSKAIEPAWAVGDRFVEKELDSSVNRALHHHTTFEYCGVHVENHFDFIAQYGSRKAKAYERELKSMPVNSPDFNALFLMRHMASHFAAEHVSIRHLVDWMLFLKNEGDKINWGKVKRVYVAQGMMPFVEVVAAILKTYLGYECPYLVASSDERLRERVVNEILYGEFQDDMPVPTQVVRRIAFKWRRRWQGRWKHNLCTNTPWMVDLCYGIVAKIMKPRTILH